MSLDFNGRPPIKIGVSSLIFVLGCFLSSAACFAGDFEDGQAAYKRGDYKTAMTIWTRAANKGDARTQTALGVMYENGRGVQRDYEQATFWYRKAADQG